MICPRCKCEIADDSKICEFCGKKIRKKKLSLFAKNKIDKNKALDFADSSAKSSTSPAVAVKFAAGLVVCAVLVVSIILIIVTLTKDDGLNYAKDLSEYINQPILTARNETDIYIADESAYDSVNNLISFDYIVECEKDVEADGMTFPKWAVVIRLNDNDEIANVTYIDFTIMKKSYKGEKTKEEIILDKFAVGDKLRKVNAEIGIDPFTVSFNGIRVTYNYYYYFENNHKDEQAMSLSVTATEDDLYDYSTSQRVYQPWII